MYGAQTSFLHFFRIILNYESFLKNRKRRLEFADESYNIKLVEKWTG